MSEIHKSYYAIIPANIRYDTSVTPNAKLLYGEITALCNERGYCWASNDYFANLYGVSKKTISSWITQLRQKGYITSKIIYREGSKEIKDRYIQIGAYPMEENVDRYPQNHGYPMEENVGTPMEEKVIDNNTLINNTINNTSNNKKKKKETEFDLLIEGYTDDLELRNTIYEFIKMRKTIKAPMTSNALKLMLNKLDKLSDGDKNKKFKILEQSIMSSWKGIFELKSENDKKPQKQYGKESTKSSFNNFKPRDYDYDSLESKLLEWNE